MGHFVGQHIYAPRRGIALQINAFNFPVWGMLEKLGPAFLAGVPTVVKPASQTSYLAQAVVAEIIASGLIPEGSLQLVAGGSRGLLDPLDEQDTVAFTGSASTAAALRAHPRVLTGGVRFSSEADSLNFSVLGADVAPGSVEFDLYVRQLVTEMTAKAGQKCTAIRRALVPEPMVGAVIDAVQARIADKVRVGNPAAKDVTMGALVGLAQRDEVRRNLEVLAGAARIVVGDPDRFDLVDADPRRGAFLPPILLHAADPARTEPHDIEVFGPVSTVLGYRDTAHAVELAARGRGSLVGSLVSADPAVVRDMVLGVAPWHGRVLVLDRNRRPESTGHGSPLPHPGARRPGPRRRRRGARRHPRHEALHAAHRDPGLPAGGLGRHRHLGDRRAADHRRGAPVPQEPGRAADRRRRRRRPAGHHPGRHRGLRRPVRRHLLRPHGPARPPRPTRSSRAASPTATSWCRWPPGCSCPPSRGRCWPTSACRT